MVESGSTATQTKNSPTAQKVINEQGQAIILSKTRSETPLSGLNPKEKQKDAATGASAAGARAIGARMVAFYFRAPVKAFFRPRVDYMAYVRAINPRIQSNEAWSLGTSTPGLLGSAIKAHGWDIMPKHVLPPLLANVAIGTILYTSYLQTLSTVHAPSSAATKRPYPPPAVQKTFAAGFAAGTIHSVFAAPLDALQVRFKTNDLLEGKYKDMWRYGWHKLAEIGPRGVLAGWGLSAVRDSFGFGVFFSTFEYIKAQAFYSFITAYYGNLQPYIDDKRLRRGPDAPGGIPTIRPHFAIEPVFLLGAGISASLAQQAICHPLGMIQDVHYNRLEGLDLLSKMQPSTSQTFRNYRHAYEKTFEQCSIQARRIGGWRQWLYRGFFSSTLRQIPSTSAGLIIFELVRRYYGDASEEVRIEKDGYDILLL